MNASTRFSRMRLLLCVAALLAWSAGSAHADTKKKYDDITAQSGPGRPTLHGIFTVRLTGEGTVVKAITAQFEPRSNSKSDFALRDRHVKIEFFDENGMAYGRPITQGNNPKPVKEGRFEWIPQREGGQPVKEGEIHVSLFEKRKGKMTRIGLVKWGIEK